jgi:hypothetical protein
MNAFQAFANPGKQFVDSISCGYETDEPCFLPLKDIPCAQKKQVIATLDA